MGIFKVPPLPGFGMRPVPADPSPYAVALLGEPQDLPKRTRLSLWLVRKDVLKMGCNNKKLDYHDNFIRQAMFDTVQAFSISKRVNPYHLNDVFFLPLDLRKSSPGIPWAPRFKNRGEVMDNPQARQSIRYLWHQIKLGQDKDLPDCKILYRAHMKVDGAPKIRAVYGYPTTVTLAEAQFALPLINAYKEGLHPIAYGYDMALGGAMKLRREIHAFKHYACLDFSGFDKSVSADLIKFAFSVLESNINFSQYKDSGIPDARKLHRVWEKLVDYFINTTMRMPTGERFKKTAGVPSGSFFTQLIDSIVNYFLITYASYVTTSVRPHYLKVFGDDSVMGSDYPIPLWRMCEVLDGLGMSVSPTKSISTSNLDQIEFLGFTLSGGFPQRSNKKWLSSLYYPEYPDARWDNFASRALGLFYANSGVNMSMHFLFQSIVYLTDFELTFSRDFLRYMQLMGIEPGGLAKVLPSHGAMLMRLL
nr:MAG: RNA-dependent RNA polymerase [Riboviria sp.]